MATCESSLLMRHLRSLDENSFLIFPERFEWLGSLIPGSKRSSSYAASEITPAESTHTPATHNAPAQSSLGDKWDLCAGGIFTGGLFTSRGGARAAVLGAALGNISTLPSPLANSIRASHAYAKPFMSTCVYQRWRARHGLCVDRREAQYSR